MKACKFFIDSKFLAEKLGIEESQLVIGEVNGNHSMVEFVVLVDSDAITNQEEKMVEVQENLNIRRRRFQ